MKGPKVGVIVIPVARCNLSCAYCYITAPSGGRMDDTILHTIFAKVFHYNGADAISKFTWHGFEPLLAGKPFYEKVVKIQKQEFSQFPVVNYLQTNGTLLTPELAEFLIASGFRLGVSLDGPQLTHDKYRRYPSGKGTYVDVMRGIDSIRKTGASLGVIGVLTSSGAEHIAEIYDFFKRERLEFDLLPVTLVKEDSKQNKAFRLTPKQYGTAAIKLFDLWFSDSQPPQIRSCDSWTLAVLGTTIGQECTYSGNCFVRNISVDPCGDVWPCERFDGVDGFKLGNILTDDITEIINSKVEELVTARRKVIERSCGPCSWYPVCQGGCPHQAFAFKKDYRLKDYFCEAYKAIFQHIKPKVEAQLERAYILTNTGSQKVANSSERR